MALYWRAWADARPEVQITPRMAEAARLGITAAQIADTVRVATVGDVDAALAKLGIDSRQVPIRVRRLNGMLPWYGAATDLEDFIVYSIYGHKREHAAQIAAYRGQWSQLAWRWDSVTP